MTERQGRLVSKIQGYEGKDQKTSQSLSSVCSWVPRRESEASKRWEESWWWGDRSSSSPGQRQNSNYRQRWHVMESFTLHLYRKGSGQTHVSTYSMIGRIGNERKAETLPLPQPHYHAYGIRREENLMQEQQTDVSLCRRQAGQLSSPCSGTMLGDVWAFLSPQHTDSLQELQISAGCCQQWPWEAVLRYLFQFAIQLFTVLPVACRYHTAKRASREMFDSQPLLQKHWTTTDAESQTTAPTPVTIPPVRAAESSTHMSCFTRAFGAPPDRQWLSPHQEDSWSLTALQDSRVPQTQLSRTVACDLAYFYSKQRLKDSWVWERWSQEAVPDHSVAVSLCRVPPQGWAGRDGSIAALPHSTASAQGKGVCFHLAQSGSKAK